ncbi:helix-turn-helix domain-containing protein [Sinorhizobium meliloti]|nr:helix-turn-helix domain-containing protein [Sinorhizobium meliloti]MDX0328469.1 helix-turn-helix domain-containing protein [Sinorhizobium meliloti]
MRRSQADKDVDATVANIRRFRETSGISQKKLGDAIGVTFQQVQKYESGKDRISASKLVETARALGCDLNSLFAGIEIGDLTLAFPLAGEHLHQLGRGIGPRRSPGEECLALGRELRVRIAAIGDGGLDDVILPLACLGIEMWMAAEY